MLGFKNHLKYVLSEFRVLYNLQNKNINFVVYIDLFSNPDLDRVPVAVRVFWQPCSTQYPPQHICSYKQPSPEISRPVHLTLGQGFVIGVLGRCGNPFYLCPSCQAHHTARLNIGLILGGYTISTFPERLAVRVFWLDGHSRTNFDVLSLFSRKSGLSQLSSEEFLLILRRSGLP